MKQSDKNIITANAIATAQQQFGTSSAANYVMPRSYYYCLSSADGFMALMLLTIDQMRLQCEELVRFISRDKSIYHHQLKNLGNRLYSHNCGCRNGICVEVERAMQYNMTADEIMGFGVMASHIDEVMGDDIAKMSNSIFNEVGRAKVPHQHAFSRVLSAHLFGLVAAHILDRCLAKAHGSHYYLCIQPLSAEARNRAYRLDGRDVQRMSQVTLLMVSALAKGHSFDIPYTPDIENGITIICNKICNIINIYTACLEAGINIGKHSVEDLTRLVEQANAEKQQRSDDTKQPVQKASSLEEVFESKGWVVKAS